MIKQATIIGIGMAVGPLVQLASTPWLARIFSPTEFGHFAIFMSAMGVFAAISCLRYEVMVQVVDDGLIGAASKVGLISAAAMMLLMSLVFLSGLPQALYPPFTALGGLVYGIPVVGACSGMMLLVYFVTLRRNQYWSNAVLRSIQPILFVALAVSMSSTGLVQAQLISWVLLAGLGLIYLRREIFSTETGDLWGLAIRFKQYPMLLMPTSLLDATALALPVLLISASYGDEATGNYAQVQRLIGAPLLLGSAVMGQMFFKHSGELYRSGRTSERLLWQTVLVLSGIAGALLLALLLAGEPVCRWLLGAGWRTDTVFLLLATVPFVCRAIVSPISTVFLTHHRVALGVRWQAGYFATTITVLYVASTNLGFDGFLLVLALHELVLYSIYLAMARHVASTCPA